MARYATRQPGAGLLLVGGAGLRWFRDRITAGDHGISRATAYRYLDEVVIVPTVCPPTLSV